VSDERDIFKANGWEQFCVLQPDDHISLLNNAHIKVSENDLLLVITQTCDLINNKEPFFGVACLRPLDKNISVENEHARNSRRLEFNIILNDEAKDYCIKAHEKFFVDHAILKNIKPFDKIKCKNTKTELVKWLTSRYSRTAFPDTFDQIWNKRKKQIEKVIKKLELVQDIYLKLSPFDEIEKTEEYDLEILLLMDADNFDNKKIHQEYDELRKKLEEQFNKCNGINVELVELESNARISIKVIQEYNRWDYSYLSYRDPEQHDYPNSTL